MFPQNSMRRMRGAVLENKTIHAEMIKALMTAILSLAVPSAVVFKSLVDDGVTGVNYNNRR